MKKLICLCLVICIFAGIGVCALAVDSTDKKDHESASAPIVDQDAAAAYIITKYNDEESEQFLWDTLSKYSPSDFITAAVLAYFWRESTYKSDATVNWPIQKANFCEEFTAKIDAGLADGSTKQEFIEEVHYKIGGYGLGQWYAIMYLDAFYDFAQDWGTSIADADMQCAFTLWSCGFWREPVWDELLKCNTALNAGRIMGASYDGDIDSAELIACKAVELYDKYADK